MNCNSTFKLVIVQIRKQFKLVATPPLKEYFLERIVILELVGPAYLAELISNKAAILSLGIVACTSR